MQNPQMVSPWQSYCNNTKVGVFIGPFYTSCCLIMPWLDCRRDHFRLQKCRKIRDFNVDFWKNFLGQSPQTPILGRGYGAPPKTPPSRRSVASRLHASRSGSPSIVRAWTFFRNISPWNELQLIWYVIELILFFGQRLLTLLLYLFIINKKAVLPQRWPRNAPYGCTENFRDSLTTPTAIPPKIMYAYDADWTFGWGVANLQCWEVDGRRGSGMVPFERALVSSYRTSILSP